MPVIRPLIHLTTDGVVLSAVGLVVYKRKWGGVKQYLTFVDVGDSTRRLDPETYHVLETAWVSSGNSVPMRSRGYKRQLPKSTFTQRERWQSSRLSGG